jgi:hypothetical protein
MNPHWMTLRISLNKEEKYDLYCYSIYEPEYIVKIHTITSSLDGLGVRLDDDTRILLMLEDEPVTSACDVQGREIYISHLSLYCK